MRWIFPLLRHFQTITEWLEITRYDFAYANRLCRACRAAASSNSWRKGNLHEQVWLLIERRQLLDGGYELRYFFSNMPPSLLTIDLARLYHERYWIEHGYQQLKEELGLDHHEGRSWTGWHRHVLLVFLAYGYLTLLRLQEKNRKNRRSGSSGS